MAQGSVDAFPDISARVLHFYHPPGCPSEPQRLTLVWCVGNWIRGIGIGQERSQTEGWRGRGGEPTNGFRAYRVSLRQCAQGVHFARIVAAHFIYTSLKLKSLESCLFQWTFKHGITHPQ